MRERWRQRRRLAAFHRVLAEFDIAGVELPWERIMGAARLRRQYGELLLQDMVLGGWLEEAHIPANDSGTIRWRYYRRTEKQLPEET